MQDILPFAIVMVAAVLVSVLAWVIGLAVAARLWQVAPERRRKIARAGVPISLALLGVAIATYTPMPWLLLLVLALAVLVNAVLTIRRRAESGVPRAAGVFVSGAVIAAAVSMPFAFATRAVAMGAYVTSSSSMAPTLVPDDRFVVDKFASIRRWDLVTFHPAHEPGNTYVSRVVGLPGETVEIGADGRVLINGAPPALPPELGTLKYSSQVIPQRGCAGCPGAALTLGADEYYLLSDNTENAVDSRYLPAFAGRQAGAVPRESVIGTVRGVYAPAERARWVR